MTTTTPTRYKMLEEYFAKHVRDVINEEATDALLENGCDASTARVLAKYRERLKFRIAHRLIDHWAMAELASIMRKTKK